MDALREIYSQAAARQGQLSAEDLEAIIQANSELGSSLHMSLVSASSGVGKVTRYEGTRYGSLVGDIAIIDLIGPIYPRANMMTGSGATSIAQFTSDLLKAYSDPAVKGIILNVDSPGGDVRGIGDAANAIYSLNKKKKKPIHSFASGFMCSAAYYIASSAHKVHGSESSISGSIGVVMKGQRKDEASDEIEVVSSVSPNKRPDIGTEEGRSLYQQKVDDLAAIFVKDIAKFRGVAQSKILGDYGQGDSYIGPRALSHGLIDNISTLPSVVAEVTREIQSGTITRIDRKAAAADSVYAVLSFSEEDLDMGFKDIFEKFKPSAETVLEEQALSATTGAESEAQPVVAKQAHPVPPVPAVQGTIQGQDIRENAGTGEILTREKLEDMFAKDAENFALKLTMDNRIFPAQQVYAMSDIINAMADDKLVGGTVNYVNGEGQLVSGTREEAIRARYESLPKHTMTQKAIAAVKSGDAVARVLGETANGKKDEEVEMTEDRRKYLLGLTSQGQRVLASQK